MATRSAEQSIKIKPFSMSVEQFRAFAERLQHFFDGDVRVQIVVHDGIDTISMTDCTEINRDNFELPERIYSVHLSMRDRMGIYGTKHSVYGTKHSVEVKLNCFSPELKANIKSTESAWVVPVARHIADTFRRRTTWHGWIRLRRILFVLFYAMIMGLFLPLSITAKDHSGVDLLFRLLAYIVSTACVGIFAFSDRIYSNAFPQVLIVVRDGPRRFPYESLMALLAVVGIVVALR